MFTENEENRRMMSWGRGSYDATPICRCRVLYLGSAVPHVTKDGLQGIQEPLRELYPEQGALGARGIDSWLSVWSNGILLENVDENHKKVTRFFPIESLHYCAAVRYVLVPEKCAVSSSTQPRFLPLDSPFARSPNPNHPPLFACILRRTTGIKVLECHTFICKREMAANALVRCCFHAYADCAYAKHIDGGGDSSGNGVYGTLGREQTSNTSDKVDGWRWNSVNSIPPATLTLDSSLHTGLDGSTLDRENSNSADDLSVYNGDENHKIWVGAQRERSSIEENVYGEWSAGTMKSSRSARPRQVINAPPPPPPPTKEVKQAKKAAAKDKSKRKKSETSPREEVYPVVNGSAMRAGTWRRGMSGSQGSLGPPYPPHPNIYANGTLLRPASRATNGGPPPPPIMVPMTLPHRPGKGFRPPPPPLVPPHALYIPAPAPVPRKHYQVTREEPVYMPSARPMSPVSSYQPCHFPHEAYLMRHYATMDYPTPKKKKDKKPKNGPVGVPAPLIITNGRADGDEWSEVGMYHRRSKEEKNGKASSMSVNAERRSDGSDSPFDSDAYRKKNKQDAKRDKNSPDETGKEDDEDDSDSSPFNTGIYKRKGHLNERAFSYSIRQEHRSRSYGSLANLKFAPLPVVPNGGGPPVQQFYGGTINKEEMKKEREIMQMMQDLDLSADEIERSEVSPSVYQAKQRNAKIRR